MNVELKLFAVARDLAGRDTLSLELPEGATVGDLRGALVASVPELTDLVGHMLFAVDTQYADDSTIIPVGADIACIPPVSGG